jgi:DNA mismatch endonuclease, patch repair protein
MTDIHSKEVRSYNMSRIKAKDTKPELIVRKFLHAEGFRYRLYDKNLPGKPDIVLKKYNTVIFIHGCFWHGHKNCKYFKIPATRTDWWKLKIRNNSENDLINQRIIDQKGMNIIIIWECELRNDKISTTLSKLKLKIFKNGSKLV